jgi:cell wall-associated NlpC family hydrolase
MKKATISFLTGTLLLFGSINAPFGSENFAMAEQTISQSIVTIKSTVNVRTGPSTSYKVIAKLQTNEQVNLVEKVNSSWLKVERSGRTGYISARFAEISTKDQAEPITVTIKGTVNVRTGPSTSYHILGKLYTDATVNLVEQVDSNWLKVERDGRTGYISAYFAEIHNTAPTDSEPVSPEQNNPPSEEPVANKADQIILLGQEYIGTRYEFGASTGNTSSFDCSSFTQYIFGQNEVSIPRSSRSQASFGTSIHSVDDLQKGDLIFFKTGNRSDGQIDHVAVYMGEGKIIHAIPSKGVTINNFSGFWLDTAVSAKRVLE